MINHHITYCVLGQSQFTAFAHFWDSLKTNKLKQILVLFYWLCLDVDNIKALVIFTLQFLDLYSLHKSKYIYYIEL